jgi:hypothetical protein
MGRGAPERTTRRYRITYGAVVATGQRLALLVLTIRLTAQAPPGIRRYLTKPNCSNSS